MPNLPSRRDSVHLERARQCLREAVRTAGGAPAGRAPLAGDAFATGDGASGCGVRDQATRPVERPATPHLAARSARHAERSAAGRRVMPLRA